MAEFNLSGYLENQRNSGPSQTQQILASSSYSEKEKAIEAARIAKLKSIAALSDRKKIALPQHLASLGAASGGLVEAFGTVGGLITGNMENSVREYGKKVSDYYADRKPLGLIRKEEARQREVDQQETQLGKLFAIASNTLDNPALASNLAVEQIPNLIPAGLVGRGVGAVAKVAGASANVAAKVATGAAVATGSIQQGADVAGDTYDTLVDGPDSDWEANKDFQDLRGIVGDEKAKQTISLLQAKKAGAGSFGTSLLSQIMPGGRSIERVLAGGGKSGLGIVKSTVLGFLGEAGQEAFEEGTGAISGNLAKQAVDTDLDTYEGVGEAAGLGAVGGGLLGGPAGAANATVKKAVKKVTDAQDEQNTRVAGRQALKDGDIGPLTDPESKTYNPSYAAAALEKRSREIEDDPDAVQKATDDLIALRRAQTGRLIQAENELEAATTGGEKAAAKIKIKKEETHLEAVEQALESVELDEIAAEGGTEPLIEAVEAPEASPERDKAAGKVITLLMRSPTSIEPGKAAELAELDSFNEEQKNVLLRFSEGDAQRNALKDVDSVNNEILNGGKGFKGLADYVRQAASAVKEGNKEYAQKQLDGLTRFQKGHIDKLRAFKEANDLMLSTNRRTYVVTDENGNSEVKTTEPWKNKKEQAEMGGFTFGWTPDQKISNKNQIEVMTQEVAAITATVDQMSSQFSVSLGIKSGTEAASVSAQGETGSPDVPKTVQTSTLKGMNRMAANSPESLDEWAAIRLEQAKTETDPKEKAYLTLVASTATSIAEGARSRAVAVEAKKVADAAASSTEGSSDKATKIAKLRAKAKALRESSRQNNGAPESSPEIDYTVAKNHLGKKKLGRRDYPVIPIEDIDLDGTTGINPAGIEKAQLIETKGVNADGVATGTVELTDNKGQVKRHEVSFKKKTEPDTAETTLSPITSYKTVKSRPVIKMEGQPDISPSVTYEAGGLTYYVHGKGKKWTVTSSDGKEFGTYKTRKAAVDESRATLGETLGASANGTGEISASVDDMTVEQVMTYLVDNKVFDEKGVSLKGIQERTKGDDDVIYSKNGGKAIEALLRGEVAPDNTSSTETSETEEDKLDILEDKDEQVSGNLPNEKFKGKNLIQAYFARDKNDPKEGSPNPLVMFKDFMTNLFTDGELNTGLLKESVDIKEVTDKQLSYLKLFDRFSKKYRDSVRDNILNVDSNPEYHFRDYVQFLREDLSENVLTAITLSAFNWVADKGNGFGNTDKDMRLMLGEDRDYELSGSERGLLSDIGTRQNLVIQDLGAAAAKAMGLRARKDAPADSQASLELSLGAQVLHLLIDAGLAERVMLTDERLQRTNDSGQSTSRTMEGRDLEGNVISKNIPQPFIRIVKKRDKDGKRKDVNAAAALINETSKETKGVLDKLFAVESRRVSPTNNPGKFFQKLAKNTLRGVPVMFKKIAEKASGHEHVVRKDMQKVRQAFANNEQLLGLMAGMVDFDRSAVHTERVATVEAQNEAILRDMQNLEEFEVENGDAFFFFRPDFWSTQRAGLVENVIDMQASKYQRHNVSMAAWETKIDASDSTSDEMIRFKLAVAQGMGIDVDKMLNVKSLEKFDKLMEDEKIGLAIDALQQIAAGESIDAQQQEDIANAVAIGRQNFHSLDALVNYAAYVEAIEGDGDSTFRTDIMFEVDGVTNGPALALALLGEGMELAPKFGLYTAKDDVSGFTDWRSKTGNRDLYLTVANRVQEILAGQPENPHLLRLIENGLERGGRNLVKNPVTTMMFGSSMPNSIEKMAIAYIHGGPNTKGIYEQLEVAVNEKNRVEVIQILEALNGLLSKKEAIAIPREEESDTMVYALAMSTSLSLEGENRIKQAFKNSIGEAMKLALNDQFKPFMESRQKLNDTAKAIWTRYDTAYRHLYDQAVNKKIEDGTIAFIEVSDLQYNADGTPIYETVVAEKGPKKGQKVKKHKRGAKYNTPLQELSQKDIDAIYMELGHFKPIVHTAMSAASNELDAGLDMEKFHREMVKEDSQVRKQEAKFANKMASVDPDGKSVGTVSGLKPKGRTKESIEPSVRTVILLVHALDSAIASTSYGKVPALNVHDALGLGIEKTIEGAQRLNENTLKYLTQYSMPLELLAALDRTFDAQAALVEKYPELGPKLDALTMETREGFNKVDTPIDQTYRNRLAFAAVNMEVAKLDFLATLERVDQYALEDGSHLVTDNNRATIAIARTKAINKAPKGKRPSVVVSTPPKPNNKPQTPQDTPWGVVGVSNAGARNDSALEEVLSKSTTKTTAQIYLALRTAISKNPASEKVERFQLDLLSKIEAIVGKDLEIRYITPGTEQRPNDESIEDAPGWFQTDGVNSHIGIKSSAFVNSQVNSMTVLHELVHAATQMAIANNANPKAIAELEALRQEAIKLLNANPALKKRFSNGVFSLDEFLAYGLSDPAFQGQVLAKIAIKSTLKKRASLSGMKAFIDVVAKLIYGKKVADVYKSGLGQVIGNAALLMESKIDPVVEPTQTTLFIKATPPDPMTFSTEEVYEALGKGTHNYVTDPVFGEHLKRLLNKVVRAVYKDSTAMKQAALRNAPVTAEDVFLISLKEGSSPFASKLTSQLVMSQQEQFAAEELEITMREAMGASTLVQREVRQMWDLAKEQLSEKDFIDGDWDTATPNDQDIAKKTYALLFTATANADGNSDYLSQFMAAAMAYQPLYKLLEGVRVDVNKKTLQGKPFSEKIEILFSRLMDLVSRRVTKTSGNNSIATSVDTLAVSLARIEVNYQSALALKLSSTERLLSDNAANLSEKARKGLVKITDSKILAESRLQTVRVFSKIVSTVAGDRTDQVFDILFNMRNGATKERQGLLADVFNDMRGEREVNSWAHKLLVLGSKHEQERKRAMIEKTKFLQESYSRKLSKKEWETLTPIIMRSGMHVLLGDYSLDVIEDLLRDETKLDALIKALEKTLSGPLSQYQIWEAKDLGLHLQTGQNKSANLMLNAHNIAYMGNTNRQVNEGQDKAQAVLDKLISLYTLKYSSIDNKLIVANIMREESAKNSLGNGNTNGVEMTLLMHRKYEEDSLQTLFNGSPILMQKGYTKEIFDPGVELEAADDVKGEMLLAAGYKLITSQSLEADGTDPTGVTRKLYKVSGKGLSGTITGAISSTERNKKGFGTTGDIVSVTTGELHRKNQRLNAVIRANKEKELVREYAKRDANYDPRTNPATNYMVPVLNETGKAVGYRYLMEEKTKDLALGRNNRMDNVMGNMAGSFYDKVNTPVLNNMSIDAVKADYDSRRFTDANAFIAFGPNNPDPVISERWDLLPADTKKYIKTVWGKNEMMISSDVYNIIFGYRKYSLGNMFNKDPDVRNLLEKVLVFALERIPYVEAGTRKIKVLGPKAALRLVQGENMWMEIVKIVKDILVIKNLFTLLGNEMSNMTLLMIAGVPIKDIIKSKMIAYPATLAYQKDRRELDSLQLGIDVGYVVGNEAIAAQSRIVELQSSMNSNPMKELIDEGMFQTLVEDISAEEDPYSYKSKLVNTINERTGVDSKSRVVQNMRTAGKNLLMTHDTTIYKVLSQATILSDFTSRFALHEYQTKRKTNPISREESLKRARAYFVNYDVPSHIALQYLNDTGLLWFTKYYIRIQAVIINIVRENPLGAINIMGLNEFIGDFADILDSSFLDHLPVNGGSGALEILSAWDEPITIKALDAVL